MARVHRHYSSLEIKFLHENYTTMGAAWCAEQLGRERSSIYNFARHCGLQNKREKKSPKNGSYSESEVQYLSQYYSSKGGAYCARQLGRSVSSIYNKARHLGLLVGFTSRAEAGKTMAVVAVAKAAQVDITLVRRVAKKANVLEYVGSTYEEGRKGHQAVVDASWARDYIQSMKLYYECFYAGWLDTPTAAKELGLEIEQLKNFIYRKRRPGHYFQDALRNIRRISRPGGVPMLWNRQDVMTLSKELREFRHILKKLVPLKELYFDESSISRRSIDRAARREAQRLGHPVIVSGLLDGNYTSYVTPEVAAAVRLELNL